ncbi:MAG: TonB-dependent receptor, partial [Gemmatimonadetes bacterium]|nr:TonB-dependent receptor [Gemmatimonadota bacterium]
SAPTDRFGTFTFASLADLEAGRPVQYTRWLGSGAGRISSASWAGYAGDLWMPARDLSITYGIRAERTSYDGRDAPADSGFGLSPVPPASGWSASPRAGFRWSRGSPAMDWVVRGGAGRFRAGAGTRSLAALLAEPGMSGDVRLVCVGAAVPVPRWESYRADAGTIRSECATNSPDLSSDRPGATGFARGYDVPAVWHSSLEVNWLHRPSQISADASVSMSRGRGHPLAFDRNLVADLAFRLDAEGGRPVFVAPGAVDPFSGRIVLPGSRRRGALGVVREVDASGRSAADQLALTLARLTSMGLVQAYYTYTRSRDDASALQGPAGPQPSTGGDPRRATWAPADFEQRHVFQLSLDRTLAPWSTLTLIGRVLSGQPFTPTVDADVNGDGFANDRAFVFDAADRDLGGAMAALMDGAPEGVRACLRRQAGRVAERNSCRTPWNPQLDVQWNIRPGGIRGRTAFTVVAQNTTAALDRLLHGTDDLRGWGQDPYPDPVLLRVTGFDPDERRFRYRVNPS